MPCLCDIACRGLPGIGDAPASTLGPAANVRDAIANHRAGKEDGHMPQKAWSDKRERQYEHIKDSYEDRGVGEDEAEERAARTVNKERAEKGETKKDRD